MWRNKMQTRKQIMDSHNVNVLVDHTNSKIGTDAPPSSTPNWTINFRYTIHHYSLVLGTHDRLDMSRHERLAGEDGTRIGFPVWELEPDFDLGKLFS
ncbi:hypothetical protein CsSME_00036725 [Camellia sinensis var. sinensis]